MSDFLWHDTRFLVIYQPTGSVLNDPNGAGREEALWEPELPDGRFRDRTNRLPGESDHGILVLPNFSHRDFGLRMACPFEP